ncbi:MAG: hypothetical protein ABI686_03680 [Acidobacteriota bacterium]
MQTEQTTGETLNISPEKLATLVSHIFGGTGENPNPDEPLKPGPWDPVIRKVAKEVFGPSPEPWRVIFGPQPEPWRTEFNLHRLILGIIAARHPEIYDVIGGGRFNLAALNPQPLPPRTAFVAAFTEEVIDRVLLMQEVADAINQTGEQQGIIIVGGRLSLLVDELCGNNFKIKIPIPHPKHETDDRLSGLELIVAGAICEQNAATVANESLRQELRNAGAKLLETGISRL